VRGAFAVEGLSFWRGRRQNLCVELAGDVTECAAQLAAHRGEGDDRRDRDQGRDEAVFDRRGRLLVFNES